MTSCTSIWPTPRSRAAGRVIASGLFAALLACGGCRPTGLALAEAEGVVTYQGKPVADATVVFAPQSGLPAIAQTDSNGHFVFNTQGSLGAIIGPGTISVTAFRQKRELTEKEMEMGGAAFEALLATIRSSAIPSKYGHPRTSGLTATVNEDPEQNHFTLELK